ncbi:MAG TPA: hypothetical protein VF699_04140, partial [Caulobacteraceae bacterium]
PLQSMTGGPPHAMQMGQEPPVQQDQQQAQASEGGERLSGGGQGQVMPSAAPQSANEMSQTDAGFGSTAAAKQGGLGATQTSYGQSTQHDATGGLGAQSVNTGAQGQTGVLGKSPGHDKNMATGLKDQNQGGTNGGGL